MTTALKIPRVWASDTNYSSGSASGTATKTDPGVAISGQGFIPGKAGAQHVNFVENANSAALHRLLTTQLTGLRYIPIETGVTLTDTAESMAAVSVSDGARTLLIKTAQSFLISDQARLNATGVPASITSLVTGAANSGTRIVAIGTGGNRCTYSDDGGGSWSAGADIGATPGGSIIWNSTHSRFLVATGGNVLRYSSNGAAAWTSSAGTSVQSGTGIAQFANGDVLTLGFVATPGNFTKSTDGGANMTATGGAVPNAADFDEAGWIANAGTTTAYHAGRKLVGTKMQVSSSPDGIAWTQLAEFDPPFGCTFSARARLLMCPQTGLLVLAAPVTASFSTSQLALYASVDGSNWVGPSFAYPTPGTAGVALANGRLFATRDDLFFGADGCGY